MRKEWLIAAVIFGALGGYALSPLPSVAFQTADQRERIAEPAATPVPPKPYQH
jgi:hypothetical protein